MIVFPYYFGPVSLEVGGHAGGTQFPQHYSRSAQQSSAFVHVGLGLTSSIAPTECTKE